MPQLSRSVLWPHLQYRKTRSCLTSCHIFHNSLLHVTHPMYKLSIKVLAYMNSNSVKYRGHGEVEGKDDYNTTVNIVTSRVAAPSLSVNVVMLPLAAPAYGGSMGDRYIMSIMAGFKGRRGRPTGWGVIPLRCRHGIPRRCIRILDRATTILYIR